MRAWICGLVIVGLVSQTIAQAPTPPPPPAPAQGSAAPDIARANELYESGTKAMGENRFDDAARDFLASYDISKDPALLFKLGGAYDKAGKCDEAVSYYKRYLEEGKPEPKFVDLTTERIAACSKPADTGNAAPSEPAGSAAPPTELPPEQPSKSKDTAWLFVGGALTFVTAGIVLAYSAKSSEQDVRDLYVSNNGMPPTFNDKTQERYDELIAEGKRYQYLSWTAFGIAAGCAIGAAIFFWRDAKADDRVSVTPVIAPGRGGIAATVRF